MKERIDIRELCDEVDNLLLEMKLVALKEIINLTILLQEKIALLKQKTQIQMVVKSQKTELFVEIVDDFSKLINKMREDLSIRDKKLYWISLKNIKKVKNMKKHGCLQHDMYPCYWFYSNKGIFMCAGHGMNSVGDKPTTGSYRQV